MPENENRLYLRSRRHLYAHLQISKRMSANDAHSTDRIGRSSQLVPDHLAVGGDHFAGLTLAHLEHALEKCDSLPMGRTLTLRGGKSQWQVTRTTARARPSPVRARISSRSNSARPPSTVSIKRPCAVVVSAHVSPSDRNPASRVRLIRRGGHEGGITPDLALCQPFRHGLDF